MIINYSSYHPSSCHYYLIIPNILLHRNIIIINNIITIHQWWMVIMVIIPSFPSWSSSANPVTGGPFDHLRRDRSLPSCLSGFSHQDGDDDFQGDDDDDLSLPSCLSLASRTVRMVMMIVFKMMMWCLSESQIYHLLILNWIELSQISNKKGDLELSGGRQQLVP